MFSEPSGERRIPFQTKDELYSLLQRLIAQAVPLSIGGHTPGAADEIAMLIDTGVLSGTYVEISWSGPGRWTVREIPKDALEWEQVPSPDMIANTSFNADSLKRIN